MKLIELTKICTKCGERKNWSEFHKNNRCKYGVRSSCKTCFKIYQKNNKEKLKQYFKVYYSINTKKIKTNSNDYYKSNKNKARESQKIWREMNKEKKRSCDSNYYKNNKKEVLAKQREYYEINQKKRKAYQKIYKRNNRKKVNQRNRIYEKNRRLTDPKYRLNISVSALMRISLCGNKNSLHWESLVGYTLKKLITHLEKQFQPGMSWDNYGKWHVDHKIPLSAHNFTKPEHIDFKKAWTLKNLQPMWAKENISKGAKLEKPFQPSLLL